MSSTQFSFDLDDARFVLFEQLDIVRHLAGIDKFADFDRDVCAATLEEGLRVAQEHLAPVNANGDRQGCKVDADGNVTTPAGFREAWQALAAGGWVAPHGDPELGGGGVPGPIHMALVEIFSGANQALSMYPGLTAGAGRVIQHFAPQHLRQKVAAKLLSGQWGGTMCLTEAGAGSSVGDNRARALPTDVEGVYTLEGEKIFISGGDQDFTENIVHLVLAKTPNAPEGTKGLSLFMVPKFWFDDDLSLGERNGAHVLRIEHKMGINGSSTCVLGLGSRSPCRGWLIGTEFSGIEIMFHMMNEARMGVALQGLATGSSAYQYALHYANERIQGSALKDLKAPNAPRIAIVGHPDVRRMLMTQKCWVETLRSLLYRLGLRLQLAESSNDEAAKKKHRAYVELMVPVAKAAATDRGFEVAVSAVQVFGGYGYTQDFPVEQVVRDGKIQSIYEGTNGIQALDLLGRKMRQDNGALFIGWMQEAQGILATAKKNGFEKQSESISKAIATLGQSAMHIAGIGRARDIDGAMVHAVPFLEAFATVALAVEAADQASVAKVAIDASGETNRLRGKLLNLDYFVGALLPHAIATAKSITSGDRSCLDPALFSLEH
jgi:alkylation response protein AidB-like acyl-CoA dehydrogenase